MAPPEQITRRPPLKRRQVELMLVVLIRAESAFLAARSQLDVGNFAGHHKGYAALWVIVCDHYDEFGELPDAETITTELEAKLEEEPDALNDADLQEIDDFLTAAFGMPADALKPNVAFKYLRWYLEERLLDTVRNDLTLNTFNPENVFGLLTGLAEQASAISAIDPKPISQPFPKGWDLFGALKVEKVPTGSPFFDDMLGGGMGRKEVYGLMGPHGSCKTTLAVQFCTDIATNQRRKWLEGDRSGALGFVYQFVYEGSCDEMRLRALSHAGRIARESLETGDPRLLGRRRLKPYEKLIFRDALASNIPVPAEYERYRAAQQMLNDNWRVLNMTGNDPENPGRGWGLVDEMVGIIMRDRHYYQSKGIDHRVDLITIDYAGAAVERYIDHVKGSPEKMLRHLLGKLPYHARNKLAGPFNCPVLLLHQLNANANSLDAGRVAKGTEAAEARNFRENLDFLLVLGNFTREKLAVLRLDKHRRTEGCSEQIIQLQGDIGTVRGTEGRFTYDPQQRRIVESKQLRMVQTVTDDNSGYAEYQRPGAEEEDMSAVRQGICRPVNNM